MCTGLITYHRVAMKLYDMKEMTAVVVVVIGVDVEVDVAVKYRK